MSRLALCCLLLTIFIIPPYQNVLSQSLNLQQIDKEKQLPLPADAAAEVDSLQDLLQQAATAEVKLKLLGNLCWAYAATRTHLETAEMYADSMYRGANALGDARVIANAHFYQGFVARHKADFFRGLDHLQKHINYYQAQGDSVRVATGLFQVGVINHDMGNYEKSLAAYYRILSIWKKEKEDYDVATTLNSIAVILKKMKRYDDAVKIYLEAMKIFDTLDVEDRGYVRINIGNAYAETNAFDKAARFYRQALAIYRQYDNTAEIAVTLQNIGSMFNKQQRHDSALVYHLQSFAILKHTAQQWEIGQALQLLGHTYLMLKKYREAEQHLSNALAIAEVLPARPLIRDIYQDLSLLYEGRNDFASAYRYHRLYATIKDSVLNETTAAQLNELQVKYETGEKDKQILLLAKQKEIQEKEAARQSTLKKAFIAGLILLGMLTVLLVYIFRQRLKNHQLLAAKNNEVREADFKRQMTELEMKALRAQINPHFLFNCMNSINRMILKGETDNASSYLTRFSKLLRRILENAEAATVSLDNELSLLRSYIELEALRFKGRINYQINVDPAIEPEHTYLPSMVLQPFVENAIWHGLMHKQETETGQLFIEVKESNDTICCSIEDNGVGREKAEALRSKSVLDRKSLGMKITEERLRLIHRNWRENFIHITDLKDREAQATGTRVEINIPIV